MEFENEDQRKDSEVILKKMKEYYIGECNETYERYVFNRRDQEPNESVDAYVTCTALQKLAKTCNYVSLTDSHIRDRMVVGINDNSASMKLLQTSKLTLGQCRDICISLQTSARQLKEMNIKRMSVSWRTTGKKQEKKRRQRFQRRAKTSHKNVGASFVPDIILSLRKAALHGEHLARIVAS